MIAILASVLLLSISAIAEPKTIPFDAVRCEFIEYKELADGNIAIASRRSYDGRVQVKLDKNFIEVQSGVKSNPSFLKKLGRKVSRLLRQEQASAEDEYDLQGVGDGRKLKYSDSGMKAEGKPFPFSKDIKHKNFVILNGLNLKFGSEQESKINKIVPYVPRFETTCKLNASADAKLIENTAVDIQEPDSSLGRSKKKKTSRKGKTR